MNNICLQTQCWQNVVIAVGANCTPLSGLSVVSLSGPFIESGISLQPPRCERAFATMQGELDGLRRVTVSKSNERSSEEAQTLCVGCWQAVYHEQVILARVLFCSFGKSSGGVNTPVAA